MSNDAYRYDGNAGKSKGLRKEIAWMERGDERMITADVAGDNMRSAVKQNPEESGGCSLKKNRSALFDMNHLGRKQRERREDILAADVRKKRTT